MTPICIRIMILMQSMDMIAKIERGHGHSHFLISSVSYYMDTTGIPFEQNQRENSFTAQNVGFRLQIHRCEPSSSFFKRQHSLKSYENYKMVARCTFT